MEYCVGLEYIINFFVIGLVIIIFLVWVDRSIDGIVFYRLIYFVINMFVYVIKLMFIFGIFFVIIFFVV